MNMVCEMFCIHYTLALDQKQSILSPRNLDEDGIAK
jgi:hypothetical protein